MKVIYVAGLAAALAVPAVNASAKGVTDAQIASIVVTANQVTSTLGSSPPPAARIRGEEIREPDGRRPHRVNKSAVELVTKLKVTPEDNATSKALKAAARRTWRA